MSNRASAHQNVVAGSAVRPVIPSDFEQATRFAQMIVQAGLFQAESQEKALAQATMAVLQGLELGIPPMQAVQQIAIIGGRCTIWGDLIPALIWRAGHTIREWMEGEGDDRVAWCEITRCDNGQVILRKFSVCDAKRAALWDERPKLNQKESANVWREVDNDNPWYRYQDRMLQMRARGFCARDGVPDVLHGLHIREEIEDAGCVRDSKDRESVALDADLGPPPAPEEVFPVPVAQASPWALGTEEPSAAQAATEAVENPDEFLADLDVSLAACRSEEQLHEVWAENLDTVCGLGRHSRLKAELIYERFRSRMKCQIDEGLEAQEKPAGAAA
jgi:hypothetical protein